MNKKIIALGIIVLLVLCFIWFKGKDVDIMKNIDVTTIEKVVIFNNVKELTITKSEDISSIVDVLKSMKLDKTFSNDRDGFAFTIDIYYQAGNVSEITITSEDIIVDGNYYNCDRNYCDDFRTVYNELLEKYSDL